MDNANKAENDVNQAVDKVDEAVVDTDEAVVDTDEAVVDEDVSSTDEASVGATASTEKDDGSSILEAYMDSVEDIVQSITRYLTRCYDLVKRGYTDIEDDFDLPPAMKVLLRDCIHDYKCSNYLEEYLPFANHENRREELQKKFAKMFIDKGYTSIHTDFLHYCALFVLIAYDLKELAGFIEAPDCVVKALIHAIVLTHQRFTFQFLFRQRFEFLCK